MIFCFVKKLCFYFCMVFFKGSFPGSYSFAVFKDNRFENSVISKSFRLMFW